MRQKQSSNSHYLTNATLRQHVGRIFLNGSNTFAIPWQIPDKPPEELVPLIYIPEYESFRDELNLKLRHPVGDFLVTVFLCFLFPPLALWYYGRLRKAKAVLFEESIVKGKHMFLKGTRAQALLESLKCGYDDEHTVAYIDVLYNENEPPPEGLVVGSPTLPLLLPVSGDGTVLHPYTIDISDVLVSSVPNCKDLQKFVDREYFDFLSQLNRYLRNLTSFTIQSNEDCSEVRVGKC